MNKLFAAIAFMAILFVQPAFAQDSSTQNNLSAVLLSYYTIKDALISGNAATAAAKAGEFVQLTAHTDAGAAGATATAAFLSVKDKLVADAQAIAAATEIAAQRDRFASLSASMYTLAKAVKLSGGPVYQDYCPMKKAYWLSNSAAIKNPYFGSQMLTCGKISDTLK